MPNGTTIKSTHEGILPAPIPLNMTAHVLPELSHSLLSIGKFCDVGCIATFDAKKVVITHQDKPNPILTGQRDGNGLWTIALPQQAPPPNVKKDKKEQANFTIHDATIRQVVKFMHLSLFSPTKSTLLQAIRNNHFVGWPALTEQNVKKYLRLEEPTILGHMDQQRQHTRSTTRTTVGVSPTTRGNDLTLTQPSEQQPDEESTRGDEPAEKTLHAYLSVQDVPTGRVYTDQTGSFPIVSAQGTKAIMVMYDYDSNAILVEGITSRGKTELVRAYKTLLDRLIKGGVRPIIQRMDNEVSNMFKTFLQQENIALELTPAHVHRRNAAERAIRTWKNHFMAGMASLNPRFPLQHWSALLQQSEITLNLLRQSRLNPRLSAYAQLQGIYDYNRTPMAPPGCEIIGFVPPAQRQSWGYHGQKMWYVRPAMHHYRCINAINAITGRESTIETVQFLPHNFEMPAMSSKDMAARAAYDLAQALRNPHPAAPYLAPSAQQSRDLTQLATIFQDMTKQLPLPAEAPPSPPLPPPRVQQEREAPGQEYNDDEEYPHQANTLVHMANAIVDPDSGASLEYRQLIRHPKHKHVWLHSSANEFGRLAQGIRNIAGTNTITFITRAEVPRGRTVTYGRFVCDFRPQKEEQHRTRLTIGGNLIDYPGDVSAPTGGLTTYKTHCNDVISTKGARTMNMDIMNYYLNTPLPRSEYMKIHISLIPQEIVEHYNLAEKADENGFIFIKIDKGMYGLPQAGILAYQLLKKRLEPHGYYPVRHTQGYWRHRTKPTAFVLVVDDFSVKYLSKQDADDFFNLLSQWYTVKVDWSASLYCGITTTWDYNRRTVNLSMPGYIDSLLRDLKHPLPRKAQHSPYPHVPIAYGVQQQWAEAPDDTAPLPATDPIQPSKIVGRLLYYARAVDSTLNVALSALAAEQNKPTMHTKKKILQILDYCATHPNAILPYVASDMILKVHSDAGYNNEPHARSRAGGHFFLGNSEGKPDIRNGAVLNPTHIIKHVASSAAEAEIGAAFINCKEAIPLRIMLAEMGYPQPPTPVTLDNTTAVGFANQKIKQRRTKALDMRYYWLQDQEAQQHFKFNWDKAINNLADYFTKHHPPSHHQEVRGQYVNMCTQILTYRRNVKDPHSRSSGRLPLRGCADPGSIQWTYDGQTLAVGAPTPPMTSSPEPTTRSITSIRLLDDNLIT